MEEFFKRITPAIAFLALILALGIWAVAHYSAAPGSRVAVLWGLVEYHKSSKVDLSSDELLPASDEVLPTSDKTFVTTDWKTPDTADNTEAANCDKRNREIELSITAIQYDQRLKSSSALETDLEFRNKYAGKWLSIRARASRLLSASDSNATLIIQAGDASENFPVIFSVSLVSGEADKISHLDKGAMVLVRGRLAEPYHLECGSLEAV